MTDSIKVGRRHSQADQDHIQAIYRSAMALGAEPDTPTPAIGDIPVEQVLDAAKSVAVYGSAIKALGDGRVGGYLVQFGAPDSADVTGEFFDAATDFGDATSTPVLYHHGMDPTLGLKALGRGELKRDNVGIWIEAQLDMRDAYTRAIYDEMVKTGKLGWSSGTAAHLVKHVEITPGIRRITHWPLGLDASLTPTPADPRTLVTPIKSLPPITPLQAPAQVAGDATPGDEDASAAQPIKTTQQETQTMDSETLAAIKAAVTEAMAAREEAAVKAVAATPGYEIAGATVKDLKVQDVPKQPFSRFGDFLKAVRANATNGETPDERARLLDHQAAAVKATGLTTQVGADGGFLVGPNDAKELLDRAWGTGEILSRVTRDPVSGNSNGMTLYGIDENSRATGSRWGGVTSYWGTEGGTLNTSKPSFRTIDLRLNKIHAVVPATDEMLADAATLESKIRRLAPAELAFQTEYNIIAGPGAGRPLGILNSPALVTQTKESGQTAATVNINNLAKMWARMPGYLQSNAVMFYNQDVTGQLFAIVSGATSTTAAGRQAMLQPPGVNGGRYFTFLGVPMIPVEYCSTLGQVGDVLLANLGEYQVIDKGGIQEAMSLHVKFMTDEAVYRFTYRVDGKPMWASPVTPLNGSNTVSPFVALEAR